MSTSEFVEHNERKTNRLITEKSPYLLQHAYNPVDWYPWGEEAFAKAQADNKPVFLSIGYSTCHWCHVMERESFEDDEVAELINREFVAIKVDREERPDVDHIYMSVCQAMTGRGGWPLTVVLTPDKKPFFSGTYFPKRQKNRQRGLMELLNQISEKWREDPARMEEISTQVVEDMEQRMLSRLEGEINRSTLDLAYDQYAQTFDQAYGGFGKAPKFPTSHNLSLLMRYYDLTGEEEALHMVEHTLDAMYRGGMYDHIGMGFSRYSTDAKWLVPHFEKMLYDNALLTITYTEAYLLTGEEKYEQIAQDILTYVSRGMTDSDGGFYSAEDADSEGVEGKFYVWTPQVVKEVLGDEEGQLFNEFYDITEEGNFEGFSIPNLIEADLCSFVADKGLTFEELGNRLEASRQKLFEQREKRVHPHKDDKILTSWNGLMIAAYALAGRAFQDPKYTEQARRADQFLWSKLRREDGRLLARYRDGESAFPAYLDDYAFYSWGLIELYQTTYDPDFLRRAIELTDEMLRLFLDEKNGGMFFYGSDSEQLFTRPKEIYDGAIPSGNSVATLNLLRLARMTGNTQYEELAQRQFQALGGSAAQYPMGHSILMSAYLFTAAHSREIVITGDPKDEHTAAYVNAIQTRFLPNTVVVLKSEHNQEEIVRLVPYAAEHKPVEGKPAVYVCENFACLQPITDVGELEYILDSK